MTLKRSMAPTYAIKRRNRKTRTNVSDPLPVVYERVAVAARSPRRERSHVALPRLLENVRESFVIGRVYCERCRIVATVVRAEGAVVSCPHCGALTVEASGDEV